MTLTSKIFIGLGIFLAISCQGRKEHLKNQFLLRGNVQLEKQEYKAAIRLYTEAINLDTEYADAYNNRGTAYLRKGDVVSALRDFQQAISIRPDYTDAYYNRANAYAALKRIDSSLKDLEVVREAYPDSAYVYFTIGLVHFDAGSYPQAVEAFDEAIGLDSTNFESFLNRATANYRLNELDMAEEDIRRVMEMSIDHGHSYNLQAMVEVKKGRLVEALAAVEQALELEPNNPYFLNNRGYVKLLLVDRDAAGADINESIRLDPENGWACRNKGIYYFQKGAFEDALRVLNQAERYDDQIELLYYYRGLVFQALSQPEKACDDFRVSSNRRELPGVEAFGQNCNPS